MRIRRMMFGGIGVLLLLAPCLWAQEKPKEPVLEMPGTPVKVQVVFTETQGDRKVSSLPYVLHLMTQDPSGRSGPTGKLRMGVKVPILTGKEGQYQYLDLGTNIDCSAQLMSSAQYLLRLKVSRSLSYSPEGQPKSELAVALGSAPIYGDFSADLNLLLKDTQTIQSVVSTDPVSGRTLKVDVTLNVVK